ncbi:hypothetical protein CMEL01_05704 [Colletotrichum melonis]|uniref:Uncharacterized protein n=1 Tax=Colletotrichum melonis TaxID=1209925 RepID=A0AAI9U973_9PEZI|nr:hypothetical protein CMEL01_05704 [Colletotrichum melonis]
MKFRFIILLSTAVTAAEDENTRWCNHEPSDTDFTCDGRPSVYCCDRILNTLAQPKRKKDLPVKRSCGRQGIHHAACVRTCTSHGHVNTNPYTSAKR